MRLRHGFAMRRESKFCAKRSGQNVRRRGIELLPPAINRAADCTRTERADRFVNWDDSSNFSGVKPLGAYHFQLRIDHFDASGALLIHFRFAVKDQLLARLEASFEIAAVKKLAGQGACLVLHKQVIDSVAAAHSADGLAAHDGDAQREDSVWPDVLYMGKLDAVFIAKGQIGEQIFQGMDAALGEQLGALGADALDHLHRRLQSACHKRLLYHYRTR